MSLFCLDRDILTIEPVVFLNGGFDSQELTSGTDGMLTQNTFERPAVDFLAAKVKPGMILLTYKTIPSEGKLWEIISANSDTSLTVSALRASADDELIPAGSEFGLKYKILTFNPRIAAESQRISERLRLNAEAAGISKIDFADSHQLSNTTVLGVLAGIFLARADRTRQEDINWSKAEFYRAEYKNALNQLRLAVDINGDGTAEQTRTLGNVTLRRI